MTVSHETRANKARAIPDAASSKIDIVLLKVRKALFEPMSIETPAARSQLFVKP